MNYNFIETPNSRSKVINTITLTTSAYLSFPTFFVDKQKLKKLDGKLYLKMYFDKSSNAVAIQFTSEASDTAYPVNGPEKYGATCKIKSFLLNNELSVSGYAGKYDYIKKEPAELGLTGHPVFILDLNKPVSSAARST